MRISLFQHIRNFFDIASPRFKTVVLILSIFYFLIIFKIALTRFNTTDTLPQLKAINTEVIKKLGPFAVRINTGMYIKNLSIFDINKNNFLFDSVIWFEFNNDEIMLETVEKFSVDNGKIISKSPPDVRITDGRVFAKYNVLFDLKTDLNFRKFPFEDHRIPIVLSNDFVTPDEMYFMVDASSFQTHSRISPSGWKLQDMSVDTGFLDLTLDKQDSKKRVENPKALFVINFIKASVRKALVIFIPLFSAAFLSLLTYIIHLSNTPGIFGLATAALTAILSYRFVIEQMMPQVGYFTTTDSIYIFLLVFTFINFVVQLLFTRIYSLIAKQESGNKIERNNSLNKIEYASSIIFIIMSLLLVITTTYIILS